MDFLALPPEITSARIYSGPGSGPMSAAASTWSSLAAELKSAAASYQAVISRLTGEEWMGPASASMVAAATPYVTWMHVTAAQAEQAATQARAAAAAYETARAMTVPPVAVTANRVQLNQLVATNILGQNTPSIAATEAEHTEMWAQDTVAMYGYHAQSTAATELGEFTPPPNPTNPGAEAGQAGAVGQAAGARAASGPLQSLMNSARSAAAEPPGNVAEDILNDPGMQLGDKYLDNAIASTNMSANNVCAVWRGLSGITGAQKLMGDLTKDAAKAAEGVAKGAAGAAQGAASAAGGLGAGAAGVAGGMGQAGALGALSVPPSWAPPAPPVTALGPVSGGSWQPVGPGILGNAPMAPPAGMAGVPGVPGAAGAGAGAAGAGFRGFGAPRYGVAPTVMPRTVFGG